MSENKKAKKNFPFIILGLKRDQMHKSKVDNYEVSKLISVIKDYVRCELLYVSTMEDEDVLGSLDCLLGLTSEAFFSQFKSK